jgi:5-(carboxyamino)imidazole ribonucleotide mutase
MPSSLPSTIAILMGSSSDWETLRHAADLLDEFQVPYEKLVVSAHRMPDDMFTFAEQAQERGFRAIIAGAGGAAHLPGMLAAKTTVPVLGVPVASKHLNGLDSLYSIVQMPKGIPVATFAIGPAGAANAALFAVAMLAAGEPALLQRLTDFRARQTEAARSMSQDLK